MSVDVEDLIEVSPLPVIELNEGQQAAFDEIVLWLSVRDRQEYKLGGYAGTGKTTLIKKVVDHLESRTIPYAVASFTGKAVSVLRRKGISQAQTLHSLLYKPERDRRTGRTYWVPMIYLGVDVIIVDEASMVSTQLYADLVVHGVKLLFVGDPAQLEPVGDNPELMRECDFTLTHIHRQAENSPIIRLAQAVRKGMEEIPFGKWGDLWITRDPEVLNDMSFDVTICAKNATRHRINTRRRRALGYTSKLEAGEIVICLENNKEIGVFNGMILTVLKIWREDTLEVDPVWIIDLIDETGVVLYEVPVVQQFFGEDYRRDGRRRKAGVFDYGYCLTAHKSQGSEWDSVLVIDEPLRGTDRRRWKYTSITRAAKRLTYLQ